MVVFLRSEAQEPDRVYEEWHKVKAGRRWLLAQRIICKLPPSISAALRFRYNAFM